MRYKKIIIININAFRTPIDVNVMLNVVFLRKNTQHNFFISESKYKKNVFIGT